MFPEEQVVWKIEKKFVTAKINNTTKNEKETWLKLKREIRVEEKLQ